MPAPPTPHLAPPRFRYVGGDPSLDLVNTANWGDQHVDVERLVRYDDLVTWAEGAGIVAGAEADRLRRRAARRGSEARAALDAALHCRGVLRQLWMSVAAGRPSARALGAFNALLADAQGHLVLAAPPAGTHDTIAPLDWSWRDRDDRLDWLLWPVVRAAAALLASGEGRRVRVCGGPDCGWIYVDRSRNGLRRWCEMETCGTAEKTRQRAARRAAPG